MNKSPFWPITTDAMIADTTEMDAEEFGAYVRLMICMWDNKKLPIEADEKNLTQITGLTPRSFKRVWQNIKHRFEVTDNGAAHPHFYVDTNNRRYISPEIRQYIYDQANGYCTYCGAFAVDHHIDHIYPIARGGDSRIENLNLSCASCNLSKGAKLLGDWLNE